MRPIRIHNTNRLKSIAPLQEEQAVLEDLGNQLSTEQWPSCCKVYIRNWHKNLCCYWWPDSAGMVNKLGMWIVSVDPTFFDLKCYGSMMVNVSWKSCWITITSSSEAITSPPILTLHERWLMCMLWSRVGPVMIYDQIHVEHVACIHFLFHILTLTSFISDIAYRHMFICMFTMLFTWLFIHFRYCVSTHVHHAFYMTFTYSLHMVISRITHVSYYIYDTLDKLVP